MGTRLVKSIDKAHTENSAAHLLLNFQIRFRKCLTSAFLHGEFSPRLA